MKNLQTEYNKDIETDLPDLWNRIEKGLDEAEGPAVKYAEPPRSTRIIRFCLKIAGGVGCAAAACLLIFVIGNSAGMFKTKAPGESGNYSASPSNSTAAKREDAKADIRKDDASAEDIEMYQPTPAPEAELDGYVDLMTDHTDDIVFCDDGTILCNDIAYSDRMYIYGTVTAPYEEYEGCEGCFVILTNIGDVTFEQLLRYSSGEGSSADLFRPEDLVIISFKAKK